MEAITSRTKPTGPGWVSRLVEVLQPLSVRADRLASMEVFAGLRWSELEFAASLVDEVEIARGTRMTAQGRLCPKLWLITEGEALVSADARPLRVATHGDVVGIATMMYGIKSPETTIALTPVRALAAGSAQFRQLIGHKSIRLRLTAAAGDQLRARRRARVH